MKEASEEAAISQGILNATTDLLAALREAETSQRGFLLTGAPQYLRPYNQAVAAIPGSLARLRSETAKRPDEAERLKAIEPLVSEKLAELKLTLEDRRTSTGADSLMEEIRRGCTGMIEAAQRRAATFSTDAAESARRLRIAGTAGSVVLLGFLTALAILISRGTLRRDELYRRAYASEKLWHTTLASIADGVIVTDSEGVITFVNAKGSELTGWPQEQMKGVAVRKVMSLVHETTRKTVENPLDEALRSGSVSGLANHTALIRGDGSEIPIDDSVAPMRGEDGAITGAVLVFRDISERRAAEREIVEAARALEKSNEDLQQFAYTAAHDMRSPLNTVKAMSELLAVRLAGETGETAQLIGFVSDGINRLSKLLDDILSFATASEVNRSTATPLPLDLAVRRAMESCSLEIQRTGAEVTATELPTVMAHPTHMLQMFQNLLGNALKYRSEATPRISIAAKKQGPEWIISVKDNGAGIAPQYSEEIFKPFKRLHGPEYEGSGIGLASCRKIAQGYGGRIWVESEPGKGSTFYFTLPVAEEAEEHFAYCAASGA